MSELPKNNWSRDYGEFENSDEKVQAFCEALYRYFARFIDDTRKNYEEDFPAPALDWLDDIYLDPIRLQNAVASAFDDIKRCADYHELFKLDDSQKPPRLIISICEHKQAGFLLKWFMHFSPVIVPQEVNENLEEQCRQLEDQQDQRFDRCLGLLETIASMNEIFIFEMAFRQIMQVPPNYQELLKPHERHDLLYLCTFRASRWQGVDLSMLFHWIEEALKGRQEKYLSLKSQIDWYDNEVRPAKE